MIDTLEHYAGPATITADGETHSVQIDYRVTEDIIEIGDEQTIAGLKHWQGTFHGPVNLYKSRDARLELPDGRTGKVVITAWAVDTTSMGATWSEAASAALEFVGNGPAPGHAQGARW